MPLRIQGTTMLHLARRLALPALVCFFLSGFAFHAARPIQAATCGAGTIRSVQAIGDDGNIPANVLDSNLSTRWSHEGMGSWIVADLGTAQTVCGASIAWYQGDARINHFVVQT